MNKIQSDILKTLRTEPYINQRALAETAGHSLGVVNRSLKELIKAGYIDDHMRLTALAKEEFAKNKPQNAIILAAGFGMRMVPINLESPKAFLEVEGEKLVERLICQLQKAGISDITVVVGFMKEEFEYLMDSYGVNLVVNTEYAQKNNLHSLSLVSDLISNTYIVPVDLWCEENPFSSDELNSWYMVSDELTDESDVRINRKNELQVISRSDAGNRMIGISYINQADAPALQKRLSFMASNHEYNHAFWEKALYQKQGAKTLLNLDAKEVPSSSVVEINTYEQLRELDQHSNQLKSDAIEVICSVLDISANEITSIEVLKKGMTNRSFKFSAKGQKYIMRIPGEGTDQLINRAQEAEVFHSISGLGLCDDPVYMNPDNGYKITTYLDGIRVCNPLDVSDLEKCMYLLRKFHSMKLKVDHIFDIYGQIEFYETLRGFKKSVYRDYETTKKNVHALKFYIDSQPFETALTHIDAVPDNFLFYEEEGQEKLQLTDWEYAGMQDPHVDIAMFCIYSLYNRSQVDQLIDIYFEGKCDPSSRIKIYCYIAACGLLWSNWCEYKSMLGVEFGEYSLRQYRYAKDYYRIALEEMKKEGMELTV